MGFWDNQPSPQDFWTPQAPVGSANQLNGLQGAIQNQNQFNASLTPQQRSLQYVYQSSNPQQRQQLQQQFGNTNLAPSVQGDTNQTNPYAVAQPNGLDDQAYRMGQGLVQSGNNLANIAIGGTGMLADAGYRIGANLGIPGARDASNALQPYIKGSISSIPYIQQQADLKNQGADLSTQLRPVAGGVVSDAANAAGLLPFAGAVEDGANLGVRGLYNAFKNNAAQNLAPSVASGFGSALTDQNNQSPLDILKATASGAAQNEVLGTAMGVGGHVLGSVAGDLYRNASPAIQRFSQDSPEVQARTQELINQGVAPGHAQILAQGGQDGFIAGSGARDANRANNTFTGTDRQSRFEISDKNSKIIPEGVDQLSDGKTTLNNVLKSPTFDRQYGNTIRTNEISVVNTPLRDMKAVSDVYNGVIHVDMQKIDSKVDLRNVLLHERQHFVQAHEGFATGSLPEETPAVSAARSHVDEVQSVLNRKNNAYNNRVENMRVAAGMTEAKLKSYMIEQGKKYDASMEQTDLAKAHSDLRDALTKQEAEQHGYKNSYGEAEADNVENRSNLSQQEINRNPVDPSYGLDSPSLTFGNRYQAKAIDPTQAGKPQTYDTIHVGNEIKQVQGTPIKLVNGVDTFVHPGMSGGFTVSEQSTGRHLGQGATKEAAIATAKSNIDAVGEQKFKQMLSENKLTNSYPTPTPAGTELPKSEENAKVAQSKLDEQAKSLGITPEQVAKFKDQPERPTPIESIQKKQPIVDEAKAQQTADTQKAIDNINEGKTAAGIHAPKPGEPISTEDFGKGSALNPASALPKELRQDFADWVNARRASTVEGLRKSEEFKDLRGDRMDAVHKFQAGDRTGRLADVESYFKKRLSELNKAGVKTKDFGSNYLPGIYKEKQAAIDAIGRKLGLKPGFTLEKEIPNYRRAEEVGLTAKHNNIPDLMRAYEEKSARALADRKYFDSQVEKGSILPSEKAPMDWKTINPDSMPKTNANINGGTEYQGTFKAPAQLADILNNYLGEHNSNTFDRFLNKSKRMVLGSGIPGTGINMHGVNLGTRATLGSKYLVNGFASSLMDEALPGLAKRNIINHLDDVIRLTKAGANFSFEGSESIGHELDQVTGNVLQKALGYALKGQEAAFETPGFGKSFPSMQLRYTMGLEKDLIKKGSTPEEAASIAAHSGNTLFSGTNITELGRSPEFQKGLSRAFLAPQFFGTNVGIAKGILQGISHIGDPQYVAYRRFALGFAVAYTAQNLMNKQLSGHYTWQNAPGQDFSLDTGTQDSNGKERYISLWGTAVDGIRLPIELINGIAKGDPTVVTRAIRNRLSTVMGAGMSILANVDYKGNPVFGNGHNGLSQSPAYQALGAARAVAGATLPQGVSAGLSYLQGQTAQPGTAGKVSTEEAIASAFGSDIRYKKNLTPDTQAYFAGQNVARGSLTSQKNVDLFNAIHEKEFDQNGNAIGVDEGTARDNAAIRSDNPDIMAAETKGALATAKQTGKPVDPLYTLSPDQQTAYQRMLSTPYQSADYKEIKANNPWMTQFEQDRQSFFQANPIPNAGAPSQRVAYPNIDPVTQNLMTQESQITDPKQKAAFAQAHPEIQQAYDQLSQYTNDKRNAQGFQSFASRPVASAQVQALMNSGNFKDPLVQQYMNSIAAFKIAGPFGDGIGGGGGGSNTAPSAIANVAQGLQANGKPQYASSSTQNRANSRSMQANNRTVSKALKSANRNGNFALKASQKRTKNAVASSSHKPRGFKLA